MGAGSSFLSLLPEGGLEALLKDLEKRSKRITKKRTKATVTQTVEQPDGKTLEKRSDGSQRRISPDGTTVETFKDGSVLKKTANIVLCKFKDGSMLQVSDTGDVIEKTAEGTQVQLLENKTLLIVAHSDGRQLQWDIPAKTGTEEHPDGSKLEWNEEAGNRVELKADGTIITTYSDGCVITKSKDGTVEQANPDGTRICSFADGRRTQYNADGSRIEFFPDGSRVDYRADGVVIKQGNVAKAKKGINWEGAAAKARNRSDSEMYPSDEDMLDSYSDSEFEDAAFDANDAVASGSFIVRGARFKDKKGKGLSNIETKILKEALSVIPYEMGLDVSARDVVITAEPAGKNALKVSYRMRLDEGECDWEMAEEVFDEIEESLTEKGGTVFANALARTSKELRYTRWLTDKFAVSYASADSKLDIPPGWRPEEEDVVQVGHEDEGKGHAGLADIADIASGKSKESAKMAKLRRKLRRASKFKTLQGSIKIKGVSGMDFDRSNHHNNALREGLKEIFKHLGLNESNLRIKLTNVLDSPRKDGLDSASVDYHVTLRGNAKDQAENVVASLKQVFGDSKARKKFLTNYWDRIPPDVGVSPSRRKRSKSKSREESGEVKGEEKRSKRDKKRKKKNRSRSSDPGGESSSAIDSDSSPTYKSALSALASSMLQAQEEESVPAAEERRMFPSL